MTGVLNSLFRAISPLWEMSLTAAYAAVVVALLRLVLKKRAPRQVLCLLWLVVFARLLIPVPLESPVSIVPDARQVQQLTGQAPVLPEKGGEQTVSHQPAVQNPAQGQTPGGVTADPVSQGGAGTGPVLTAPGGTAPFAPQPGLPAPFPWQAVVAGVWLAGVLAMGGYGLVSYLRLRRRLYDAIRAQDGAWEHPAVTSPFILGVLWPRIYLPAGLQGQPRQFILCHERAHLRRCDHIVKPVCWAALALHWFNPMVWAAFLLMSRDIEAACDEAVIRRLGPGVKADYSATLLSLATNGRVPAPCPLAFDEGDAKGRIKNVLRYRRPALWIVVVSVVMAAVAAVCLLTDPVAAEKPDADPSADPSPDASQSQAPEGDAIAAPWMLEVLSGERTFHSGAEEYDIHQLGAFFHGEPVNMTVEAGKLAIIDLDWDGDNEMVIRPEGEDVSFLGCAILHRQGDRVYGYAPSYRSFYQLKSDGTFHWSGGSGYHGTGSARFTEQGVETSQITWCEVLSADNGAYFVEGRKATPEEFDAAIDAQDAKPEPVWYVYENGQLKYAPINVPIPLDEYAQAAPVPDFLDEEQQLLYRRAYAMYGHIFGANTEEVDNWPGGGGYGSSDAVERNGWGYVPATGLYRNWNDFQEAVLSVFTQEYWDARNNLGDGQPIYTNIDGQLHYVAAARGNYGCNPSFPSTFRLMERTDDAISFVVTGYYSEPWPMEGESYEERDARLASYWDYSVDFPIRMVKTQDGWRFDEFHYDQTDYGFFQHTPNPDAPAASPDPSPDPAPEPSASRAEVTQVGDGYQVSWGGQSFPVDQSITPDLCANVYTADFDGDGREEAAFCLWASPVWVIDLPDGGAVPVAYVFDPASLRYDLAVNSVAAITPEGGMTFTYSWGALDESTRRYISTHADYPDSFFQGGNEPMKSGKPLTIDTANGGVRAYANDPSPYLDVSVTVVLNVEDADGVVIAGRVVAFQHYAVRYIGSGFTVDVPGQLDIVSDSPQGSTPSQPASPVLP